MEYSTTLLICIKLPHGFKTFALSILSGCLRQVSLYMAYIITGCYLYQHTCETDNIVPCRKRDLTGLLRLAIWHISSRVALVTYL